MRREVVEHDVHPEARRNAGVDVLEEPQHVGAGVVIVHLRQHPSGGDVHRGEQVDGSMLAAVLDQISVPRHFGRDRTRTDAVIADRAHSNCVTRRLLRAPGHRGHSAEV